MPDAWRALRAGSGPDPQGRREAPDEGASSASQRIASPADSNSSRRSMPTHHSTNVLSRQAPSRTARTRSGGSEVDSSSPRSLAADQWEADIGPAMDSRPAGYPSGPGAFDATSVLIPQPGLRVGSSLPDPDRLFSPARLLRGSAESESTREFLPVGVRANLRERQGRPPGVEPCLHRVLPETHRDDVREARTEELVSPSGVLPDPSGRCARSRGRSRPGRRPKVGCFAL